MSKPKVRGKVEVVEFNDEGSGRGQKRQRSEIWDSIAEKKSQKKAESTPTVRELIDEVIELGATNLGKKEKKKFEADQLAKLGIRRPKGHKIPLPILFSMKKTEAKREAKRIAEEKESDVVTGKKKKKSKRETRERETRRPDDLDNWKDGFFRDGVLRLKTARK